MKFIVSRPVTTLLLLCTASLQAQTNQLPNLTDAAPAARFTITDRVWSTNAGDASICLWEDDKLAALSITVDDNSAPNIDWWMARADTYGFKMNWFVITSLIGGANPTSHGTWPVYSNVLARGHDVQSHSVTHDNGDAEYRDSQIAIEANLPGHKCDFLAYPGGSAHPLDPAAAAPYYASARGTAGAINTANKITYMNVYATSSPNLTNAAADWAYLPNLFNSSHSKYRGWSVQIFHWVSDCSIYAQPLLDFYDAHRADLWCGRYGDVAKYGQERDTATLTVISNTTDGIAMTLTDQMLDSRFNYPLTIKVRLPASWAHAQATQNGRATAARIVTYNGGNYALVKAVPDQGEIALTPTAAGFTVSPDSGFIPFTVTFTDASSGTITNRIWDFGDGVTSNTTEAGITHTYTAAGTKTVQLIAAGSSGVSTNIKVDCINAITPVAPSAGFIASPTNGTAPLTVTFTDTSTGSTTNRFWDFGDGNTTNTTSLVITHTYTGTGAKTVRLIAQGPLGVSTNTRTDYITVTALTPPAADFFASPASGSAPLTVAFTDTSTGSITNRFWDFGDGTVTNTVATNIFHTYTSAATNTVQLIVSGPAGASTNTQSGAVVVTAPAPPAASFSATPVSGIYPLAVTFTDTSTGSITNRYWDFGDGSITNTSATSVAHTYTVAGTNTVQLIVSGPAGISTNTQAGLIRVAAAFLPGGLLVYDSFSDPVQTNSADPSSVPSTWSTTNPIPNGTQNHSQITAGSLSYPGFAASAGNSWTTHQQQDDYYKSVSGVSGLVAGDAVYYSFLLKVNPSDAVSQYYMRLYNTANVFSSGLAFSFGLSTDLTQIGFSLSSRNGNFSTAESSSVAHTGFDYNSSNTFLIVLGYLRGTTAANSSMNLWINPDSSTFGTATPPTPTLTLVGYNYAQEAVWNKLEYNFNGSGTGTAGGQTIDEFRIARDWAGAVPAEISAPDGDTDSDGIPDEWEAQHFGGSTNANPQAMAANGMNTVREAYIAGLNPTNPQAVFAFSAQQSAVQRLLQWNAVSGRVYSIYWTTNLLSGFQCLQSNIPWTQNSFTNANPDPNGFYRINVRMMP